MNKIVLMPIEVPSTEYCWDGHVVCEHFDNEGGHGLCTLGIYGVNRNEQGVYPKPKECADFKE